MSITTELSGEQTLRAKAEAVAARIDAGALAARFLNAFRDQIPAFRRVGSRTEPLVLANIADTIRLTLRWMTDSPWPDQFAAGEVSDADLGELLDLPRRAASRGMPLVDLLRAYYIGSRMGIAALDEVATPDERAALAHTAIAAVRMCDALATAVTRMYVQERPDLLDPDEQDCRALLDAVTGGAPLPERMSSVLASMRVRQASHYVVFAAAHRDGSPRHHVSLAKTLRTFGALAVCDGAAVSGLANGTAPLERLAANPDLVVVLSGDVAVPALRDGLADAHSALQFARRDGRTGLVSLTEYLPQLLVARSPHLASGLREAVLGPLAPHPDLMSTLRAYLDHNLDRAATAGALHIHRNTLRYRLQRIEELTTRRFEQPSDLVLLYLASHASPVQWAK